MKLEAISYARIHNNRAAAKRFNIYEKRIREWTKKQEALFLTRTTTVNESKEGLGGCREDVEKTFEKMLITRFMVIVKAGLEFQGHLR